MSARLGNNVPRYPMSAKNGQQCAALPDERTRQPDVPRNPMCAKVMGNNVPRYPMSAAQPDVRKSGNPMCQAIAGGRNATTRQAKDNLEPKWIRIHIYIYNICILRNLQRIPPLEFNATLLASRCSRTPGG